MKKFFGKKKKSASEVGSVASGLSGSGYEVTTKKELPKLHKAAFAGDLTKLKSSLKKGDINQLDKENRTPLHHACGNGKIDAIAMLVNDPSCNLNLCDNDRKSPLMLCVQSQYYNCMGADANLSDINGNTALHLASSIPSNELCNLLLDYHADVHAKNKDGATPLHLASSVAESEDIIKTLVDDGAQINEKDINGKTPLMLAASRGHLEVVQDLLNREADTSIRDNKGWTADDYASMSGHHPIAHIIVEQSVKQKKNASKTSLSSPAGSGAHLYEDVPKISKGVPGKSTTPSSNVVVGGPAFDLGDNSQDEESQTTSKSSDKSWSSGSDVSPTPAYTPTSSTKPKVNVAAFLKQREQSKMSGVDSRLSPSTPMTTFLANRGDQGRDDQNIETQSLTPQMRSRGYASNSQKGGQVSPAKPPLPKLRSATDFPHTRDRTSRDKAEAEDSPWDSDEDEDDDRDDDQYDEGNPTNGVTDAGHGESKKTFQKPSQDVLAELGFTEAEAGALYRETDMDGSASSLDIPPTGQRDAAAGAPVYATVNKTPRGASELNRDEETSSNWDESEGDQLPSQGNDVNAILAASSSLKFDDEVSDDNDEQQRSSPDILKEIEANEVRDDESSSSWDSEKINDTPNENRPVAIPRLTKLANARNVPSATEPDDEVVGSDDDDGEVSSESISSWEVDNRKKRQDQRVTFSGEKRTTEQLELSKGTDQRPVARGFELGSRVKPVRSSQAEHTKKAEEEQAKRKEAEEARARALAEEAQRKRDEERRLEQEREKAETKRETKLTAKDQQRAVAAEAMERKRKVDEERKRKDEGDKRLMLSQDRERLETALQDALERAADPSESDASELDEPYMGNVHITSPKKKMEGSKPHWQVNLPPMRQTTKSPVRTNGHVTNGVDLDNLTGTETETEDDMPADIPASLRSSQLSESLLKSGERGELEREASREKRRALDAIEKLEFAQRDIEKLREQVRDLKRDKEEWTAIKDDLEAKLRRANFEMNRYKEQLESADLELETSRERQKRLDKKLELDASERKQSESTVRELRNELKFANELLKKTEVERDDLRQELNVERRQVSLRDRLENEKERVGREIGEEEAKHRQVEALNLLLQEKDTELSKVKADRDALEETCRRYEEELDRWRSNEEGTDSLATKLNAELSDKLVELTREKNESDEALQHAAIQFNMKLHNYVQANEALTEQLTKERTSKENAQRDLEILNDQQKLLKDRIADLDVKCKKDGDRAELLERDVKEARDKKEEAERKLHAVEISLNQSQQESNNLRTSLTHKESVLVQAQREREEAKEQLRKRESELSELHRENARLLGRAETLEADVSQQETDRLRLRRELEEARNFGTSTITSQQGKLSDIVSEHQKEKIELEKQNAKLQQQVAYLTEEIKRINDEKIRKDEELARAQQDRIDTHKHMSFTESSMAQLTESQRQLSDEKGKLQQELHTIKERCFDLESRVEESTRLAAELQNELNAERQRVTDLREQLRSAQLSQSSDKDAALQLDQRLRDANGETARLQDEIIKATTREKEAKSNEDLLKKSCAQMEELIGSLQDEKEKAVEELDEQLDRCKELEAEVAGHKQMWESEVKARSKISMQLAKSDKERKDAVVQLESFRKKYLRAAEQSKSFKTKYELQRRKSARLEDRVDSYSDIARETRLRSETSESEFEERLSRAGDEFRAERSRLDEKVHRLQNEVILLNRRLKDEGVARRVAQAEKEKLAFTVANDSPRSDAEKERDRLREELRQIKGSARSDQAEISAIVNKELSAKLGQVNSFLEEREVALDVLERRRSENEERRVVAERERALAAERDRDAMAQEMESLKRRISASTSPGGGDRSKDSLQKSTRENLKLQEELRRTKHELEERKMQVQQEKRRYQTLYSSMVGGSVSGQLAGTYSPLVRNSLQAPSLYKPLSPEKTVSEPVMASTPRKDFANPILSQLRNKLDVSIAQRLSEPRSASPAVDRTGPSQRIPDHGRSPSNEYMSFLQT